VVAVLALSIKLGLGLLFKKKLESEEVKKNVMSPCSLNCSLFLCTNATPLI
jgi:hypothetical protein